MKQAMIDNRAGSCRAYTVDPAYRMMSSYTDALVDPGGVFCHPTEVADHPWFTREEKRTILLLWTRDELVLEQVANGMLPELKPMSRLDAVIEVLSRFDPSAASEYRAAADGIRAPHRDQAACRGSRLTARHV